MYTLVLLHIYLFFLLHCSSIGLIGPNGHKIGLLGLAGVVYGLFRPNPIESSAFSEDIVQLYNQI